MRKVLLRLVVVFSFTSCKKDAPVAYTPVIPDNIIEHTPHVLTKITKRVNDAFGGYFEGLPAHYAATTKKYPLLLWLHGLGQKGDGDHDIDLLGIDGIGKLLLDKSFVPNFTVNGKNFSFIVLSPQYYNRPSPEQLMSFIEYAKKNYRIDTSRIYLSGLSIGGIVITETAARYASALAAIASMAGVMEDGDITAECKRIADAALPVWAFHNEKDPTIPSFFSSYLVATINSFIPPVRARLTLFNEPGHDAWTKALNADYKEDGRNVYEWMLQYTR